MLSAATVLAVIIYCSFTSCSKCIKKQHERKQIKTMNSFNTIEVSANPVSASHNNHASEQSGLMKADANFFDEDPDKARPKKMKISDAIEDQDDGKKKQVTKKKKKKGTKKGKDADINMLNVQ